jgi:hypothetical protein
MTDWQLIETAPRDGTPILVCVAGQDWVDIARWGSVIPGRAYTGWMIAGNYQIRPTHWMPVPLGRSRGTRRPPLAAYREPTASNAAARPHEQIGQRLV